MCIRDRTNIDHDSIPTSPQPGDAGASHKERTGEHDFYIGLPMLQALILKFPTVGRELEWRISSVIHQDVKATILLASSPNSLLHRCFLTNIYYKSARFHAEAAGQRIAALLPGVAGNVENAQRRAAF